MHIQQNTKHNNQSIHPVLRVARTTTVHRITLSTKKKRIQLHIHTYTKPPLYFLGTPNKTNSLPPPRIYLPRAHPTKHKTQQPKYPSSFVCRADNHRPPYHFVNLQKKSSFACRADNHRPPYHFVNKKNDTHIHTHKAPTLFFRYTEQDQLAPSSTNLLTACTSNKTQNTTTKASIQFCVSRGQPPSLLRITLSTKKNTTTNPVTHTSFCQHTHKPPLYFLGTPNKTNSLPPPRIYLPRAHPTKHKTQQPKHPSSFACRADNHRPPYHFVNKKKRIQLHIHIHTKPPLYFLGTPNKTNSLPPPRIYLPRAHPTKHKTQQPKYPSSFACRADNHRPPYHFVNKKNESSYTYIHTQSPHSIF